MSTVAAFGKADSAFKLHGSIAREPRHDDTPELESSLLPGRNARINVFRLLLIERLKY